MDSIRMSAPCLFGIEGVLADELRRMGASEVTPDTGKVLFPETKPCSPGQTFPPVLPNAFRFS